MTKSNNNLTNKIFTISNVITLLRIFMIPAVVILMFSSYNIEINGESVFVSGRYFSAFILFVLASISDGLDGWIARKTNTCSKLGKLLDPIADRCLIIACVISLSVLNRLPWWITFLVLLRDISFMIGGAYLLKIKKTSVDVIMLGKVATTFMYVGIASLILGWPTGSGLGVINLSWLPGLGSDICFYGIYLVYISVILNIFTCIHYVGVWYRQFKS